jgi:hypothetical protein
MRQLYHLPYSILYFIPRYTKILDDGPLRPRPRPTSTVQTSAQCAVRSAQCGQLWSVAVWQWRVASKTAACLCVSAAAAAGQRQAAARRGVAGQLYIHTVLTQSRVTHVSHVLVTLCYVLPSYVPVCCLCLCALAPGPRAKAQGPGARGEEPEARGQEPGARGASSVPSVQLASSVQHRRS